MAFSFFRGVSLEAIYQKEARIGMVVKMAKKIAVFRPPPTFQEKYSGIKPSREKRTILEKPSDPAASAGRGAFLIEGHCDRKYKYISSGAAQPFSEPN